MQQLLRSVLRRAGTDWRWLSLLLLLGAAPARAQTNDDCAQAQAVAVSANCAIPVNGSVAGATQSLPPTASCGFNVNSAIDVWYSFVATGTSQLITLAPRFAAIMDIRSGDCATTSSVFCAAVFQGNTTPATVGGLTPGQTYLLRVYPSTVNPPTGINSTFALCIAPGASTSVPVNDDCAGAIDIPVQASGICGTPTAGDNSGAGASAGVPAPGCAQYVGGDIWFKVTVPASGGVAVQTLQPASGSPVTDTGLALYSGTCTNLTLVTCNDDGGGVGGYSQLFVTGRTPGEVLYVRAWEFGGNVTGPFALCATSLVPPSNDECAGALTVPVNATCTPVTATLANATQSLPPTASCGTLATATDVWFSFVATGSTHQVVVNSHFPTIIDVRGACGSSGAPVFCGQVVGTQPSTVTGLTPGQTYFMRVYAATTQPTLANSTFSVCVTPGLVAPANDECAGAVLLPVTATCSSPVTGDIRGATQSLQPTANCGNATTVADVWYSFVATGTTQTLTYTGNFLAIADVRTGTCAGSTSVFCRLLQTNQGTILSGLTAGQTYFLRLYNNTAFTPTVTTFTLCLTGGPTAPVNDECAGAVPVGVSTTCTTPVSGNFFGASQSVAATTGCGNTSLAQDVWYSFVATGSTQTLTVNGSLGVVADVRAGTCASSSSVFCGTTFASQPLIVRGLTMGQTYYLRLYPNSANQPTAITGTHSVCLTAGPPAVANDECAQAVALAVQTTCVTATNGTVLTASQSLPPTTNCANQAPTAADVWYSFVASGPRQLITLAPRTNMVLDVRSGTCAASSSLYCNLVPDGNTAGSIVAGLTTGSTYFIRVYSSNFTPPTAATATFTICVSAPPTPPANDECAGAVAVPVTADCSNPVSGTFENASQSLPVSGSCGFASVAQDVWYRFVATGPTHLLTLVSRAGMVLDVRTGTCASSTSLYCNVVTFGNNPPLTVGGLVAGTTYYVRLYPNTPVPPQGPAAGFTLCINPAATPPANDECTAAISLTAGATCTPTAGTLENASRSSLPSPGCNQPNTPGHDVWYSFVATAVAHRIQIVPGAPVGLELRGGTCATSTSLYCGFVTPTGITAHSVGNLTVGQTYLLRLYAPTTESPTGAAAAFTVCITGVPTPPANDDCAGAITVPVQYGTNCTSPVIGSNINATATVGVPAPGCGTYNGGDIWYKATVPASGLLTLRTVVAPVGDIGNTNMAVYSGSCGALTLLDCDVNSAGSGKSRIDLTGRTPGETVYVRLWQPNNNRTGNIGLCITAPTPTCFDPTAPAAANPTATTVDLTWLAGGTPAAGTTYTVIYGPSGFDPATTGTTLTGITGLGTTLNGLTPSTLYCFYLRQDCPGTAGSSLLVGPTCFTTAALPPCPAPTALQTTGIGATTATASWTPGAGATASTTYQVEYGPQGFTLGTGTIISVNTGPTIALPLPLPNTTYCYYVRQSCPISGTGFSVSAGPSCFTTGSTPPPAPANDEPCGALPLTLGNIQFGTAVAGTTTGATTSTIPGAAAGNCANHPSPNDVWFVFDPQSSIVNFTLTGAAAGLVRIFTAPDCATGPFTQIACAQSGASGTGVSFTGFANYTPGQRYYMAVSGYDPASAAGGFTVAGANIPLGTRPGLRAEALTVYPNPSHGGPVRLRLHELPARGEAVLLNALGQEVQRLPLPAGSSEQPLRTAGLARGLYTLRVVVGSEAVSRKVVLE